VLHLVTLPAKCANAASDYPRSSTASTPPPPEDHTLFGMLSVRAKLQRESISANTQQPGRHPKLNPE
jgi:hypothetical protein